jgi:hypothetical protein
VYNLPRLFEAKCRSRRELKRSRTSGYALPPPTGDFQSIETAIGDEGAQALKGLVNLIRLNLSFTDIRDEGAQALKGLVKLTSLNLYDNRIGDGGRRRSRASSTSPAST